MDCHSAQCATAGDSNVALVHRSTYRKHRQPQLCGWLGAKHDPRRALERSMAPKVQSGLQVGRVGQAITLGTHMRRAFTLVELLVVMTIIVVLIALLAPSLDKATSAARNVVCMSNLHVWTYGMRQYSMDHKGKVVYIPRSPPRGTYWFHKLASY